jgi:hypothetical protein
VLIEIKKAHNGKFWNGLASQLPSYLTSDDSAHGWYVAVRYREGKQSDQRLLALPKKTSEVAQATSKNLRYVMIDGRPKDSASNI